MIARVDQPRRPGPRSDDDYTIGCGQPPQGYQPESRRKTGRVCAGTGGQLSCALCPHSPDNWRVEAGLPPAADVPASAEVAAAAEASPAVERVEVRNESTYHARPGRCDRCGNSGASFYPAGWRCPEDAP